jgi:hypothetical protein
MMSEHVCQLFDSNETRAESVADYLSAGLRGGEYVIAVMRPANWALVAARLEAFGISVQEQIAHGRLAVYDAPTTLARISPRGRLSPFAFNETVGAAIQPAAGRRVRAYGEMVDILAERGDINEALELEELWNRAGEMVPLSLMCGYSAAHFVAASTHRGLRDICLTHTDVRRNAQDALANWVLTTAHHPASPSSSLH